MSDLSDGFGRRFRYLRLSVTEACNFRCTYCLPDGYRKTAPHDFLRPDEVTRLARAAVGLGLAKIRLTGGEPSVRRDLPALIEAVANAGASKVALTTNGWSLARDLDAWIAAGLTHLNVSVDSLSPETFRAVTGHDRLGAILAGVDRALAGPLRAVKLNAVLLRDTIGADATGMQAFADYVRTRPVAVRFIELMRTGDNAAFFSEQHVSGGAVRAWLSANGWRERPRGGDDGPAFEFERDGYAGRIGLIAPYASGFCDSCNRLRVTARGALRLCLFGEGGVDLRPWLQNEASLPELKRMIACALHGKAAGHRLHEGLSGDARHLAQMGG
jgi:cyclic pyranopterin phosphate synthase